MKLRIKEKGFSLTELLVVISVILILITISAAVVASARRKAQLSQCMNNLKQYGIALHSFLAENSEFPLRYNPASELENGTVHKGSVWLTLAKYGLGPEEKPVHSCPSGLRQVLKVNPEGRLIAAYGYNAFGFGGSKYSEPLGLGGMIKAERYLFMPVAESAVLVPAEMIAFSDGVTGWNDVYEDGVRSLSRSPSAKDYVGSTSRVMKRHDGTAVLNFADGHVSAMTLKRLFEDKDDAALRIWNRDYQPHRERLDQQPN